MLEQSAYTRREWWAGVGDGGSEVMAEAAHVWAFVWEMVCCIVGNDIRDGIGVEKPHAVAVVKGWQLQAVASIQQLGMGAGGAADVEEAAQGGWADALWQTAPGVWGYSFKMRRWGWALVQGVSEIRWEDKALDALVLPPEHREVLSALLPRNDAPLPASSHLLPRALRQQQQQQGGWHKSDQGLVILLAGPPGVGKRSTARAFAEACRRPLYSVAASHLGASTAEVEAVIGGLLACCNRWGAVLVIEDMETLMGCSSSGAWSKGGDFAALPANSQGAAGSIGLGVGGADFVLMRLLEEFGGLVFMTATQVDAVSPLVASGVGVSLALQVRPRAPTRRLCNECLCLLESLGLSLDACMSARILCNERRCNRPRAWPWHRSALPMPQAVQGLSPLPPFPVTRACN